jgi:hypothetical protein
MRDASLRPLLRCFLYSPEWLDRVVDDGGEGNNIAERNRLRRLCFVRLILLQVRVAQSDFVLIIEPILIVRASQVTHLT